MGEASVESFLNEPLKVPINIAGIDLIDIRVSVASEKAIVISVSFLPPTFPGLDLKLLRVNRVGTKFW